MLEVIRVSLENQKLLDNLVDHLLKDEEEKAGMENLKSICGDDRSYLLVALSAGVPVGYVLAYRFPSLYLSGSLAYLYDIEVLKEHRRKGIGRLLIESIRGLVKADGVQELWLGTGVDNIEGQALFSSTGAKKSDESFNDYTYYL